MTDHRPHLKNAKSITYLIGVRISHKIIWESLQVTTKDKHPENALLSAFVACGWEAATVFLY